MSRILLHSALLALSCATGSAAVLRVAVTGAGGQTGGHVFRKMLVSTEFQPVGIVRTKASRDALLADTGAPPESVVVADVAAAGGASLAGLAAAMAGCAALVIGTSAKVKPTGGINEANGRPNMGFPDGQPYDVDWLGQKAQIDAAKQAGVGHVAICSSMGGTDPAHMLNSFGRLPGGKTGGGILHWKRKAEKYLVNSGLTYTIVHPGGLLTEPGSRRKLVVGIDDTCVASQNRSIPRQDVAEVLINSLIHPGYKNRSFDLISEPDSGAEVATDFSTLLDPLSGANSDYSLGFIPDEAAAAAEEKSLRDAAAQPKSRWPHLL